MIQFGGCAKGYGDFDACLNSIAIQQGCFNTTHAKKPAS